MDNQRTRILLVEDDLDDVWILRSLLADRWDGGFELLHCDRLAAGIERCAEGNVDAVLLDLSLPDGLGLETFQAMYDRNEHVPIIVLTGLDDREAAVKAVQAGAQDYLVKGQVSDELLVRSLRYGIERMRRHVAEETLRAAQEEFRIARQIQQRLFPDAPPRCPGFEMYGKAVPAAETAGDYFDYIPLPGGRLGVVVGDVSSHGMGPALVMAETRACLRTLAQVLDDPSEILTRANRVLLRDSEILHFVTLAFARIDPADLSMVYAGAGQQSYLIDPSGLVEVLESTSIPLGIDQAVVVPAKQPIRLLPGQILALFTDGVAETESREKRRFGDARAIDCIRAHAELPAREIVETLFDETTQFRGGLPQEDDVTIVIVKVLRSDARTS
ncbi:MAG: fused response regulator/phosphatase [Pirellulales bacterium]|nr:fused response regulator/phosphatase [Pirellulales bacterium]